MDPKYAKLRDAYLDESTRLWNRLEEQAASNSVEAVQTLTFLNNHGISNATEFAEAQAEIAVGLLETAEVASGIKPPDYWGSDAIRRDAAHNLALAEAHDKGLADSYAQEQETKRVQGGWGFNNWGHDQWFERVIPAFTEWGKRVDLETNAALYRTGGELLQAVDAIASPVSVIVSGAKEATQQALGLGTPERLEQSSFTAGLQWDEGSSPIVEGAEVAGTVLSAVPLFLLNKATGGGVTKTTQAAAMTPINWINRERARERGRDDIVEAGERSRALAAEDTLRQPGATQPVVTAPAPQTTPPPTAAAPTFSAVETPSSGTTFSFEGVEKALNIGEKAEALSGNEAAAALGGTAIALGASRQIGTGFSFLGQSIYVDPEKKKKGSASLGSSFGLHAVRPAVLQEEVMDSEPTGASWTDSALEALNDAQDGANRVADVATDLAVAGGATVLDGVGRGVYFGEGGDDDGEKELPPNPTVEMAGGVSTPNKTVAMAEPVALNVPSDLSHLTPEHREILDNVIAHGGLNVVQR